MNASSSHAIRVCQLSTVHPRNDTRILLKVCESLVDAGYDVHLIVGDGKGEEVSKGTKIHDIGANTGSRLRRMIVQPLRAIAKILELKPAVVHFHDPELILAGVLLRMLGFQVIYDVHEDVPQQILSKQWIPTPIRKPVAVAMSALSWFAGRLMSVIVAATPSIAQRFPDRKTVLVQNMPLLGELSSASQTPQCERLPHFVYVGGISLQRGLNEMVQSVALIEDEGVRLQLYGRFSPKSLQHAAENLAGWHRVDFHAWADRPTVANALGRARAGLVLFHPEPNHINAQPNKLFEYMAAGLPVIASNFPLWREIVSGAECGLLVDPMSADEIAAAMRWILAHPDEAEVMGRKGSEAVMTRWNWQPEAERLLSLYRRLLDDRAIEAQN